jgi:hypothetical protein
MLLSFSTIALAIFTVLSSRLAYISFLTYTKTKVSLALSLLALSSKSDVMLILFLLSFPPLLSCSTVLHDPLQ